MTYSILFTYVSYALKIDVNIISQRSLRKAGHRVIADDDEKDKSKAVTHPVYQGSKSCHCLC